VVGFRGLEKVQFVKGVLRHLTVPKFVTTTEVRVMTSEMAISVTLTIGRNDFDTFRTVMRSGL
jgi:hypothetical protein